MYRILWLFLLLLLTNCNKDSAEPNETNPWKLLDKHIKERICSTKIQSVKWVRTSSLGFDEMVFNSDQVTASYTSNIEQGGQAFRNLTFKFRREEQEKRVVVEFYRNGLHVKDEIITSLSDTTWANEVDSHMYIKQ